MEAGEEGRTDGEVEMRAGSRWDVGGEGVMGGLGGGRELRRDGGGDFERGGMGEEAEWSCSLFWGGRLGMGVEGGWGKVKGGA